MKERIFVIIYALSLSGIILSCENSKKQESLLYSSPVGAFIAHAGGQIDGYNYTNSLEALDLSYSKGCRMFELDLQLTSDNKIVAAHDPVFMTETEFMAQPILGKFTPMNMAVINEWFAVHEDAILVTDKINDPLGFLQKGFLFKDRLIMELFTWEAVEKAIEIGINPLISENLFFETKNIEEKLDSLQIKFIGMNRLRIAENKDFLRRLKEKGIKNYVWGLEAAVEDTMPEYYVWDNEMDYCYGMYANSLDKLESLLVIEKNN
jgi:glycerophosphoryl diester phosphodiesterase